MRLTQMAASVMLGAIALAGCKENTGSPPAPVGNSPFKGTVKVEFLNPDKPNDYFRDMKLIEPFGFIDSTGLNWDVPAGSVTNGASVPPGTWNIVGGPYDGIYREAAVLHDYYVEIGLLGKSNRTAKDTHRMFFEAMRARGVSVDLAKTMYLAVQLFGPTWEIKLVTPAMVKGQMLAGATAPASPAPAASPTPPAPPAVQPAPPAPAPAATPDSSAASPAAGPSTGAPLAARTRSLNTGEIRTLEDMKAWIERENPSLEEIDKRVNEMRAREGKTPVQ